MIKSAILILKNSNLVLHHINLRSLKGKSFQDMQDTIEQQNGDFGFSLLRQPLNTWIIIEKTLQIMLFLKKEIKDSAKTPKMCVD